MAPHPGFVDHEAQTTFGSRGYEGGLVWSSALRLDSHNLQATPKFI